MDNKMAMTSPTELLPPEVFPEDITDLNGNAMRAHGRSKGQVEFYQDSRSRLRFHCVFFTLAAFIIATAVMTGLFAWRMISFRETKTGKIMTSCFTRARPVPFNKLPPEIENYLESWRDEIKFALKKDNSDIALVNVVYDNKVIWEAKYSFKNDKITKDERNTVYPVASVTKVITSLLAFKLHNDGNLTSLDNSVTEYEPQFSVQNPFDNDNGRHITIRHLISFLSGLPREAPCFPDNEESYCPHNNSYIMQRINESRLLFSPGTDILYGNLQFALAGQALSRNYPGGYRKLVHDKIFVPLGMRKSFFNLNDTVKDEIYAPHVLHGEVPLLKEWGWLDPAGGLLTTVDDLAQLEMELFKNSPTGFLKSAILDEFFSPVYFFTDGKNMLGSPWNIRFHKGYLLFTKDGYVYGYRSEIYLNPHLRLALNVLTPSISVHRLLKNRMPILTDLFHKELMKMSDNTHLNPVSNPERFVGHYYTTEVPTLLNVDITISTSKIVNSTHHILSITLTEFKFDLTYVGDNVFEMVHKQCENFALGVNREKVYFKESNNTHDRITKFVIFGIHLRGKATFHRKS